MLVVGGEMGLSGRCRSDRFVCGSMMVNVVKRCWFPCRRTNDRKLILNLPDSEVFVDKDGKPTLIRGARHVRHPAKASRRKPSCESSMSRVCVVVTASCRCVVFLLSALLNLMSCKNKRRQQQCTGVSCHHLSKRHRTYRTRMS